MMNNDKAPTNAEKWFPNKKYVPVIATGKCPLTYSQKMVYSYLVFRLRKEQTASRAKMVKVLRLAKSTVSKALGELEKLGWSFKNRNGIERQNPMTHRESGLPGTGEPVNCGTGNSPPTPYIVREELRGFQPRPTLCCGCSIPWPQNMGDRSSLGNTWQVWLRC